jgi:hypothetical protein
MHLCLVAALALPQPSQVGVCMEDVEHPAVAEAVKPFKELGCHVGAQREAAHSNQPTMRGGREDGVRICEISIKTRGETEENRSFYLARADGTRSGCLGVPTRLVKQLRSRPMGRKGKAVSWRSGGRGGAPASLSPTSPLSGAIAAAARRWANCCCSSRARFCRGGGTKVPVECRFSPLRPSLAQLRIG